MKYQIYEGLTTSGMKIFRVYYLNTDGSKHYIDSAATLVKAEAFVENYGASQVETLVREFNDKEIEL